MQLVLERCPVRPWRLDDAQSVVSHANNRKVWLEVRDLFPHPYTIQDAHEFLHRAIGEQPEMKFCVEIEDAAVGGIGVHPGQDVYRYTATVGYWLGEQISASTIFRSAESPRRCLQTIQPPHACCKKLASLSKDASRTMSSKTGSFSIH